MSIFSFFDISFDGFLYVLFVGILTLFLNVFRLAGICEMWHADASIIRYVTAKHKRAPQESASRAYK